MVLAVLTVEADANKFLQVFFIVLILHRGYGFIQSRVERLYVVLLKFGFQNLMEVQNGFVCVADLEILTDHPCDSPSREKAFSCLCSFFLDEESSFDISVDHLLETIRHFRIKNRSLSATWHQ